jgi:enterochelin esterase family protein
VLASVKRGTSWKLYNEYRNTKIYNIKKQIEDGNYDILNEFWAEIDESGSPIIEEIPGNKEHSLVTFIYRGKEETNNVILFLEFDWKKFFDYKFERVLETELWYITILMRNDVRFSYMFSVNDSFDDDWEERSKNLQQDELNKNRLIFKYDNEDDFIITYVVMPEADNQIRVKERDSIVKGNIIEYKFKSNIFNNERKIWV